MESRDKDRAESVGRDEYEETRNRRRDRGRGREYGKSEEGWKDWNRVIVREGTARIRRLAGRRETVISSAEGISNERDIGREDDTKSNREVGDQQEWKVRHGRKPLWRSICRSRVRTRAQQGYRSRVCTK
jgi:hypothetical protein